MTTKHLAKNLHHVYFGRNWTGSKGFKDAINTVSLEEASKKTNGFNTIFALTYHIHYYVKGTMDVLKGGTLDIRDKYSFDYPTLKTEMEWQAFKDNLWSEAKEFIGLIEALDDAILHSIFVEEKYGSYYRNLLGIIEHTHYHLGQIVIIKKMICLN